MEFNYLALGIAALLPLLFGAVWYTPAIEKAITGSSGKGKKHPAYVFVLCVVLAIPPAMMLSIFQGLHGAEEQVFTHGLFHGAALAAFTAVPAMIIHFIFEGDRSFRNGLYHCLYWMISFALIGGVVFAM